VDPPRRRLSPTVGATPVVRRDVDPANLVPANPTACGPAITPRHQRRSIAGRSLRWHARLTKEILAITEEAGVPLIEDGGREAVGFFAAWADPARELRARRSVQLPTVPKTLTTGEGGDVGSPTTKPFSIECRRCVTTSRRDPRVIGSSSSTPRSASSYKMSSMQAAPSDSPSSSGSTKLVDRKSARDPSVGTTTDCRACAASTAEPPETPETPTGWSPRWCRTESPRRNARPDGWLRRGGQSTRRSVSSIRSARLPAYAGCHEAGRSLASENVCQLCAGRAAALNLPSALSLQEGGTSMSSASTFRALLGRAA